MSHNIQHFIAEISGKTYIDSSHIKQISLKWKKPVLGDAYFYLVKVKPRWIHLDSERLLLNRVSGNDFK